MREAPEVIYLQWYEESYEDNTWCQDQIHDDDIEYIKKDMNVQTFAEQIAVVQYEAHEWEKKATRRLELLRRYDEERFERHDPCVFCGAMPEVISVSRFEYRYKNSHADDCELAKELADEVGSKD